MRESDDEGLVKLFTKLADYYAFDDEINPDANELWLIYDSLATAFSQEEEEEQHFSPSEPKEVTNTVYTKDYDEIK